MDFELKFYGLWVTCISLRAIEVLIAIFYNMWNTGENTARYRNIVLICLCFTLEKYMARNIPIKFSYFLMFIFCQMKGRKDLTNRYIALIDLEKDSLFTFTLKYMFNIYIQ